MCLSFLSLGVSFVRKLFTLFVCSCGCSCTCLFISISNYVYLSCLLYCLPDSFWMVVPSCCLRFPLSLYVPLFICSSFIYFVSCCCQCFGTTSCSQDWKIPVCLRVHFATVKTFFVILKGISHNSISVSFV